MPKLTEEQIQYIKEHPGESTYGMADKFGCSVQTIYAWLHSFHGDKPFEERKRETERKREGIRRLYPTHSASEVAKALGISKQAVNRIAKRMGVRHTDETSERLVREGVALLKKPEIVAKRINTLRRVIRMEQFRIINGVKPKTKRKFKSASHRSLCARNYLRRKYNYFYDKDYGELLTLFYDSDTKRLPEERERHYSEKYHIKFVQSDE